ncbi:unnamed protein product, partial [Ilex paraguariensis]
RHTQRKDESDEGKVDNTSSKSRSSEDSSPQEDEKNFPAFVGSQGLVEEVETSLTIVLEGLNEEVPTYEEDVESFEDIQNAYDQLSNQFLKKQKRVLVLSGSVNTSEEDRKGFHVDLVKSKAHTFGIEEEMKFLQDKVSFLERACHELIETKKHLDSKVIKLDKDLHESDELSKRLPLTSKKLNKMWSIGKSVGDKWGLGYTSEHITTTSPKTMFMKGNSNPPPQELIQAHLRLEMVSVCT